MQHVRRTARIVTIATAVLLSATFHGAVEDAAAVERVEPEDATDVDERQRPVTVLTGEPACRVGDEPRPLRTDARCVLAKERDRVQQHGEHQPILGIRGRREAQEGFGCVAG